MKILSITAQKPHSTGSGVYLTELVREFHRQGHTQAVVAGVYKEDVFGFPEGIEIYPVYFKTNQLPFPIAGMSDEMPYESTVYGQMTQEMVERFEKAFLESVRQAVEQFAPDLILCHHLYLVTALVRDLCPYKKVYGFCHNTDLRQMKKIELRRDYIRGQIQKMDGIFALHEEQKKEIMSVYNIPEEKIQIVGAGYNQSLFYAQKESFQAEREKEVNKEGRKVRIIFAGKLSEKKGVISLLRSLSYLPWEREEAELCLAGGYGREEEYALIRELAQKAPYKVEFLGRLTQEALAEEYRKSDIFVLPSFYEGLPMTVIEAMACGNVVVVTDLPGIQPWLAANIGDAPVIYVKPPKMKNTDEPVWESLPVFEREVAEALVEAAKLCGEDRRPLDLKRVSWETICHIVIGK